MSLILRPYQQDATAQVETIWEGGIARCLLVLPTGTGKTECAKHLIRRASRPLAMAHRTSLVEQLSARLGCEATSVQALRARMRRGELPMFQPDLVVWDEVHHADSPDWQGVFSYLGEDARMLGLSATPWRFDHGTNKDTRKKSSRYGKGLGDFFKAMVIGITPRQAVQSGYLVPLRLLDLVAAENEAALRAGRALPFKGGKIGAGDDVRIDILDAWQKYGESRKTMVFCHLVAAAEQASARFNAAGIPAEVIHGKLPPRESARRLEAFKRNEYRVLVNVMQLTEGVDVPDVSCIVIDRGANELNTYVQICGRAARPAPGKVDGLIIDLSGCSAEHGDPQKDQEYWVVTSEARNVSNQCCDVCGTRVSPMFPGRCMRCDPFRPKLGAPQALLDTGARVYCALSEVTKRFQADIMAGSVDKDAMDRAAVQAIEAFMMDAEPKGEECQIANAERTKALEAIQKRELERQAEARRAEEMERMLAERRAREEERQRELKAYHERIEQQRADLYRQRAEAEAAREKARQERAEQARMRSEESGQQVAPYEHKAALSEQDVTALEGMLLAKFATFQARGWGVSMAAKEVRDAHPRWKGKYEPRNYAIPPELCRVLAGLDTKKDGLLSRYELERMMKDQRTAQYGEAWCRKKVRQLFSAA